MHSDTLAPILYSDLYIRIPRHLYTLGTYTIHKAPILYTRHLYYTQGTYTIHNEARCPREKKQAGKCKRRSASALCMVRKCTLFAMCLTEIAIAYIHSLHP